VPEIPPFYWVIATRQYNKLIYHGRLAVALHYTEFQAIPPSEISMTQHALFPLRWTPLIITAQILGTEGSVTNRTISDGTVISTDDYYTVNNYAKLTDLFTIFLSQLVFQLLLNKAH